jgi:hypothetical protein
MVVSAVDFASFHDFSIGFLNCSDNKGMTSLTPPLFIEVTLQSEILVCYLEILETKVNKCSTQVVLLFM